MRDDTASIERLSLEVPAKVNLTLRVLGARSDGYHDLESVVVAVSLFDALEFEAAPDLTLTCEGMAVPAGNENLVMKAARRLVAQTGCRKGAHIRLTKRIPAGRGFGGGSSDAAATLLGLNILWRTGLADEDLARLGATLGSDVPLFFGPPVAVMRGRGERLEPVDAAPGWCMVLAWPEFGLPTAEVYAAYDRLARSAAPRPAATEILKHLSLPAREARALLVNDLEPAACVVRGARRDVRAILENAGAAAVGMTGSGSAYFALADTEAEAGRLAEQVRAAGVETWIATSIVDVPEQKEASS